MKGRRTRLLMRRYAPILFLLVPLLLAGCRQDAGQAILGMDVNEFIQKQDIQVLKEIRLRTNGYVYLFYTRGNEAGIYVLKEKTKDGLVYSSSARENSKNLVMSGGVEDGSIGLLVFDKRILEQADYFRAIVNHTYMLYYKFTKDQKYYALEDEKYHDNDLVEIQFYNERGEEIGG